MAFKDESEDLSCPWSLDDDELLVKHITLEAGRIALSYFARDCSQWSKSNDTPVSEADIAVDTFLRSTLSQNRTGYGWLSEETEDAPDRLRCGRLWVVDPIDGTRAFLANGDDWCVSVALVQNRRPVIAALYAPVKNAFYFARAGCGASKNGMPIHVAETRTLDRARMMGHEPSFRQHALWPTPWPETMECQEVNSIALRLAQIADGQFDACVTLRPKNDWDMAAADLILKEAGGTVTNAHGDPLEFNHKKPLHEHIVASIPSLNSSILERVQPALDLWKQSSERAP